jgi:histone H3/H4
MVATRVEKSVSLDNDKGPVDDDQTGVGGVGDSADAVQKTKNRELVTGHGKGKDDKVKGGVKRHLKTRKPVIEDISKNEINHLARRAGVSRIGRNVYQGVHNQTQNFLDELLFKTLIHVDHRTA